MALYDDKWWLLSHIQHSFVFSDDTGNSEMVITARDTKAINDKCKVAAKAEGTAHFVDPLLLLADESEELDGAHSFEIRLGRHGYPRPRCNTEIKLEKLKRDKKNLPKVRTINFKENPVPLSPQELEELFPRKEISTSVTLPNLRSPSKSPKSPPESGVKSLLSRQLDARSSNPADRFDKYCGHDAKNAGPDDKTRKMQIYLDMSLPCDRAFPLVVQVNSSAKVSEIIGYICWAYQKEGRKPELTGNVEDYALYMAEPDGTIEFEFQSLDPKEPLSKFGFNLLGLVDTRTLAKKTLRPEEKIISVTFPDGTFSLIEIETREISLKQLMDRAFSRRKPSNPRIQHNYFIERKDSPGEPLDQDLLLTTIDVNEFYIVRENSRRKVEEHEEEENSSLKHQISALEAPMYREYHDVFMFSKVKSRVEVMLGISEDKIEVYPKLPYSSKKFWKRQKSFSNNMEGIVACDITKTDENGMWVFRLTFHTDHGYKKHYFEAKEEIAGEINSKINHLLVWKNSEARADYLIQKEKKLQRRQSWQLK